jgi:hypothetical protein
MANGPVFPRVHAMVLCDGIARADEGEEVYNLTGVRTQIRAGSFPYSHPQLCVYMQATGHEGVVPCRLALVQAGAEGELLSTPERQVQFYGPLHVVAVVWRIRSCSFPLPGLYYAQVYFEEKLANERLLVLSEEAVPSDGKET